MSNINSNEQSSNNLKPSIIKSNLPTSSTCEFKPLPSVPRNYREVSLTNPKKKQRPIAKETKEPKPKVDDNEVEESRESKEPDHPKTKNEPKEENASKVSISSLPNKKDYRSMTPASTVGRATSLSGSQPKLISQTSEESRTGSAMKRRSMHPAKRRAAQSRFLMPKEPDNLTFQKGPNAFSALRRLSRGNFNSIRRAGI